MKLAELLNVDTTKENWFKLLSKKGINPKTVNAVSKGGGGDGGVKEYYYKDISDNQEILFAISMLGVKTILCEYRDNSGVGEGSIANINDEWAYNHFYKKYFKLSTLDTYNSMSIDNGDNGIGHCYFNPSNDLYGRIDDIAKLMPEFKEFKNLFVEVSKEEYESQITYVNRYNINIEDLG